MTVISPPASFRADRPEGARLIRALVLFLILAVAPATGAARTVTLSIDVLDGPGFSARGVNASVGSPPRRDARLDIGELSFRGQRWSKVRIDCPELELAPTQARCPAGIAHVGEQMPLSFSYSAATRQFALTLEPKGEWWQVQTAPGRADVQLKNAALVRLARWLPPGVPALTGGTVSGTASLDAMDRVQSRLELAGVSFADQSGAHAADKIGGTVQVESAPEGDGTQWRASVAWKSGELYWAPFYLAASGQQVEIDGLTARGQTQARRGRVSFPGIGDADFTGQWDHQRGLQSLDMRSDALELGSLYDRILKPLLQGTVLGDLRAEGSAAMAVRWAGGTLQATDVTLTQVSLEDKARRFALFGVNGRVPWQHDVQTTADITARGAEVLKVPIGAFRLPLRMRGLRFAADELEFPVLDGKLHLSNVATAEIGDEWRWRFKGELTQVSMSALAQALGVPLMHGSLSGSIPEVVYRKSTLAIGGALVLKVFDGTITASNIELAAPFGPAPLLRGDLTMRGLDLDLLTRAYSFGSITGRIDADVRGVELVSWRPVHFDARVASSPGNYQRRISQRAVQNISSLGGAGAAAAIQRSLLRFFEQFGYEKLGLRCLLRNGVCEMDGIEQAPQGYVIVKGGGIPAVTVIGYNRHVNWAELVSRIERIVQGNAEIIVK